MFRKLRKTVYDAISNLGYNQTGVTGYLINYLLFVIHDKLPNVSPYVWTIKKSSRLHFASVSVSISICYSVTLTPF